MQQVGLLVSQQVHEYLASHFLREGDLDSRLSQLAGMVVGWGLLHLLPHQVLPLGGQTNVADLSHYRPFLCEEGITIFNSFLVLEKTVKLGSRLRLFVKTSSKL